MLIELLFYQTMASDQLKKIKHKKNTLQRMITFFQVQKSSIPLGFKENKVDAFVNYIQAIMNFIKQIKYPLQQQ